MDRRNPAETTGRISDSLTVAKPKKRGRQWKKEYNKNVVAYRNIPPALHEQIKEIAKANNVLVSDLARYFLEFALNEYKAGNLELRPVMKTVVFTLFPGENGRS